MFDYTLLEFLCNFFKKYGYYTLHLSCILLCKWNFTVGILFCWSSFPQHYVYEIHSCSCRYLFFTYFHCCILFHCMIPPHYFVLSNISRNWVTFILELIRILWWGTFLSIYLMYWWGLYSSSIKYNNWWWLPWWLRWRRIYL